MADAPVEHYVFAACTDPACRFRFPVAVSDPRRDHCPRCGASTNRVEAIAQTPKGPTASVSGSLPAFVALLDNIRSTHNVGSMFRTADGAGLSRLYLCGITATPEHPKLSKAALGAHITVPWSYSPNGPETAAELRAEGYTVIALERLTGASAGLTGGLHGPLALVVGNERAGVDPGIAEQCDAVLSLPMVGRKSSLNAAVAFGIAVYALRFGLELASPAIGDNRG